MASFYDSFQDRRDQAHNNWQRNFVLPYGSAYSTATGNFFDTIDLAKKAAEADREMMIGLAMFALTFAGGSLLTSVFGSAALKTLASKAAVDVICRNEWEKAFKAASFVSTNNTAQFVLGTLWDKGESIVSGAVKAKLKESSAEFPTLGKFAERPLNLQNHLEGYVRDMYNKVIQAGRDVNENPQLAAGDQQSELNTLMKSYFFTAAPLSRVNEDAIAIDIELSLFLRYITETDFLVTGYYQERPKAGWSKKETSRTPIAARPTDTANYPKYQGPQGLGLDYQEVDYRGIRDEIKKRTNELCRQRFYSNFFGSHDTWWGLSSDYDANSREMVNRAFSYLDMLGARNRSFMKLSGQ